MLIERREFLGVCFDSLTTKQTLARLREVTDATPYGYLVTPNVDHIVRLHESPESARALSPIYERADMCLCDSNILHALGRARGINLPVVPGSELTSLMFDRLIEPGDRVAVVGGDDHLLRGLRKRYRDVEFVQHEPPMGLRRDAAARRTAAEFIANSGARFTFVAVGSPQQEMIAAEAKDIPGGTGMALCIGASLEFLTGQQTRAPRPLQRLGLEWAHRLLSNPKRMWRRYLVEGPRIFVIAYRWAGPGDRVSGAQ